MPFIRPSILDEKLDALTRHPLYNELHDLLALRIFMQWHSFAVWDFMTLLKSLQRRVTCVELPWRAKNSDAKVARLINEIVLGEESDLSHDGRAISHYALYLEAMKEVGADSDLIEKFVGDLDDRKLPSFVKNFVNFNLNLAINGQDEEVAAVFFWGREKLVPKMFEALLPSLEKYKEKYQATFYYFDRHIEVDSHDHGPKALEMMDQLVGLDEGKKSRAQACALQALELRYKLWDGILNLIQESARPKTSNTFENYKVNAL